MKTKLTCRYLLSAALCSLWSCALAARATAAQPGAAATASLSAQPTNGLSEAGSAGEGATGPELMGSLMSLSAYVTSGGVQVDLWTTDESGCNDIVVYSWTGSRWAEVGRVPGDQVLGEGSNHYMFLTQALVENGTYLLKIVNESGREYILPEPLTVKALRMCVAQLTLQTMTLSITTECGRSYMVKTSPSLSAPPEEWVNEAVSLPTANGWSDLTAQPFMAGDGTQMQIRIPRNRIRAFYKVVLAEDR